MSSNSLTRRDLLQRAAYFVATAAVPQLFAQGEPKISPVMSQLSAYMAEAAKRAVPDEVAEQTKLHVLDTLAAMISGSELPPGRTAINFAEKYGGERTSTIVATPLLSSPIEAAMTNGMLAHSDETDDSHAPSQSHPGCSVVPAAMAVGEKFGITGGHFLHAVALGYDVGCRVTMTLGGADFQIKTHRATHSVAGDFGASAAAGSAAGLNPQQMRWLLDYAAQQSSGIAAWQRDSMHIEKAFTFGGMPARNGVTAALVVSSGWTGVDDIFSGADNFLVANVSDADPGRLIQKLGERYEIVRTNIKKWSVGSPIQAPLDAMEFLMSSNRFTPEQVQQIVVSVGTEEAGVVNNRDIPDVCLQHLIALMLVDGTVTFRSAHDKARMQDPTILRQRAKSKLVPSEELQKELPRRVAIVEVILTDGTHLQKRVDAVRGTAENPMSHDEVVAKARDLIAPVLGVDATGKIIKEVSTLDGMQDIRQLTSLLLHAI
jgi:2-methylcitrate dehydratase PrpD